LSYFHLFSQTIISIPDTLIPRGKIYHIDITGNINQNSINNLKLTFLFDSRVIDIKSVSGSPNSAIKCNPPVYNFNYDITNASTLDISCDNVQNITNGIICSLDIEGLVGPDSIAYIIPTGVFIDGTKDSSAILQKGLIIVPGEPIFQKYIERLGQNYPNPFSGYTFFPFTIAQPAKVKFLVYSYYGQLITSSDENDGTMIVLMSTKDGNKIISNLEVQLSEGNYYLQYSPSLKLSSGAYFLEMITDNGVYNIEFIFLK
jgi:hypothetical protein